MRFRHAWLRQLALAALLSACGGRTDDPASAPSEINKGTVDADHPAVGLVFTKSHAVCTGTLIAPDVVLTAAHCVVDPVDGFFTGPGEATVRV